MTQKKPTKSPTKRSITTMRLSENLLGRLSKRALKEGRSRTNLAEYLLERGLRRQEKADAGDIFD